VIEALLHEPAIPREHDGYVLEEATECRQAHGDEQGAREAFGAAFDVLSRDTWFPPTDTEPLARTARLG
jgi:hypothetical protein